MVRDLSRYGYWELKYWRDDYAEKLDEDFPEDDDEWRRFHREFYRQLLAEHNAEIARRCWKMRGAAPPDGYLEHYSPMWRQAHYAYFDHMSRRAPWVETAEERAQIDGFIEWMARNAVLQQEARERTDGRTPIRR